jgi:hypothetical protein
MSFEELVDIYFYNLRNFSPFQKVKNAKRRIYAPLLALVNLFKILSQYYTYWHTKI